MAEHVVPLGGAWKVQSFRVGSPPNAMLNAVCHGTHFFPSLDFRLSILKLKNRGTLLSKPLPAPTKAVSFRCLPHYVSSQGFISKFRFPSLDATELGSEFELYTSGRELERHINTPSSASVFSPQSLSSERKWKSKQTNTRQGLLGKELTGPKWDNMGDIGRDGHTSSYMRAD